MRGATPTSVGDQSDGWERPEATRSAPTPANGEDHWSAAQRAVVFVLLVAVPTVFDTTVRPVFALPKFTVAVAGAAVLLVLAGAERMYTGSLQRRRSRLEVPVLLFLGWTAVAALTSRHPSQSMFGTRESLNGVVTITAFVVIFFAASRGFERSRARSALAVLWFGGGGIVLLYGAIQLRDQVAGGADGWDPIPWLNTPGKGLIWSTLGNPNDLAGFLAIILPVGLALLFTCRSSIERVGAALMIGLLLVELAAISSRGALVAATAATLTFVASVTRQMPTRNRSLAVVAAALLVPVCAGAALVVGVRDDRNIDDVLTTSEGTTAALRLDLWRAAWQMAEEDPLSGVGPDGFGDAFDELKSERFVRTFGPDALATDAHNLFLTVLATSGFPGLIAFTWVAAGALGCLRGRPRLAGQLADDQRPIRAAVGVALLAYLVQASFNRQDIALDFCFWMLVGLSSALDRRKRSGQTGRGRRAKAATATSAATAATPSATQETASSPSSSSSAAAG